MFFLLQPRDALLSDACPELIETYKAVRRGPSHVLRYVSPLKPRNKHQYYAVRDSRSTGPYKRAAEFIYLNKTCWNGLYRVNADGRFNVPYGAPKTNHVVDRDNLRACSAALRRRSVSLAVSDFEAALGSARRGDFVFLDPPYVTGHNNNGFVDYNETLFSWSDQKRLSSVAHELAAEGVNVIVTNAMHDDVVALYGGFRVRPLIRPSTLAGSSSHRRRVTEAVLWFVRE